MFCDFENKTIIHLHIPKAAGTTMNHILVSNIGGDKSYSYHTPSSKIQFHEMPRRIRSKNKLIYGHLWYGFHEYIDSDPIYICVLRNPSQRIFSHYHYIKTRKDHPLNSILNKHNATFGEILERAESHPDLNKEFCNKQTRVIGGDCYTQNPCLQTLAENAVRNLTSDSIIVGFTEKIESLLTKLSQLKIIKNYSMKRLNAGSEQNIYEKEASCLNKKQRKIFSNFTRYDNIIYDLAFRLFSEET